MIICIFRTRGSFTRTLQANEHNHARVPFLGREGRLPGIQHVAQLTEDGLLDDAALVGAGGQRLEVDDALDVGLQVADHLELDVGLQERAGDVVEAVAEDLLVDHRVVAHLRQRAGDAPAELREHHVVGLGGYSLPPAAGMKVVRAFLQLNCRGGFGGGAWLANSPRRG